MYTIFYTGWWQHIGIKEMPSHLRICHEHPFNLKCYHSNGTMLIFALCVDRYNNKNGITNLLFELLAREAKIKGAFLW